MLTGIVRYASLEIHGGDLDSFGYEITSFPPGKNPDTHGFKKKWELLRARTSALTI